MTHRVFVVVYVGGPRDGERERFARDELILLPMDPLYKMAHRREEGSEIIITYEYRSDDLPDSDP